jgi:hypothetical protein
MNANVFARRVFPLAGIDGLVVPLSLYFLEHRLSENQPPANTHPGFYYGFVGSPRHGRWRVNHRSRPCSVSARDAGCHPRRPGVWHRCIVLFIVDPCESMLAGGVIDLILAALFVIAFRRTLLVRR